SWPQLILYLIHFVLFQNAFELTYSFWIWVNGWMNKLSISIQLVLLLSTYWEFLPSCLLQYEFGMDSCFHEHHLIPLLRMAVGVGAQFLCSYITLPLYALVTQMGSTMKRSIFDEQTSKALMQWHKKAHKKAQHDESHHDDTHHNDQSPAPHHGEKDGAPSANIMATVDINGGQQEQNYAQRDLLS
ncbi:MLO-like protein 5, partial [Linum grandiflorum]